MGENEGPNMGGHLREADLQYAELKGCNLENAILDKAKVLKKDIKHSTSGADVSKHDITTVRKQRQIT
ncbi:MAG: pentapeptide repeat-containing protein [Eggerthellaceae bacterium]